MLRDRRGPVLARSREVLARDGQALVGPPARSARREAFIRLHSGSARSAGRRRLSLARGIRARRGRLQEGRRGVRRVHLGGLFPAQHRDRGYPCGFQGCGAPRQASGAKSPREAHPRIQEMSGDSAGGLAARLDRLPASRAVWIPVVLISLGGVFEFYDLFFTAYVAPGMVRSGLFTPESLGRFGSLEALRIAGVGTFVFSTFAGLWVGVMVFGAAADRFGRKAAFTGSLLWYVGCTAVMAFQRTGEWINIWRFVAGIGFGVQLVTIDTYIVELVPRTLRGRAFSANQCICFCAVPMVALLAWLLGPPRTLFGLDGWRVVMLIGSVGAIAVWILRSGIPESPRWLASRGRLDEAEQIVATLERRAAAELGRALPAVRPVSIERHG